MFVLYYIIYTTYASNNPIDYFNLLIIIIVHIFNQIIKKGLDTKLFALNLLSTLKDSKG